MFSDWSGGTEAMRADRARKRIAADKKRRDAARKAWEKRQRIDYVEREDPRDVTYRPDYMPDLDYSIADAGTQYGIGGEIKSGLGGVPLADAANPAMDMAAQAAAVNKIAAQMQARLRGEQQSYLESIIGPVDQFDAYAEGFRILSGAMQTSFDGWVSGALTAGQALKQFFSQAITGIAQSMFARAIEHGAMAIGQLAIGNLPGAALHGKAAAANTIGAIAIGAIARQLNGSSASPPAGVGAGAGGGAPTITGAAGASGGRNLTIVVGESLGMDSNRQRQARIASAIRMSRRELEDNQGVRFA